MFHKITVELWCEWGSYQEPLMDFIVRLENLRNQVADEHRHTATIEFRAGGDDESGKIVVSYRRPQTPQEVESEARASARYETECIARERRQYEALKAKFEKTT